MSQHLDLEEQEQLDQIKHFWARYGNLITWALIAVLGAYASWNAYNYWQRKQAAQAAVLFEQIERGAASGDLGRAEQAFSDIKDKFGRTLYAQQAGLLMGKTLQQAGKADAAQAALAWVTERSTDEGYQALARLRLAGLLLDSGALDDALKQLSAPFPAAYAALADDRRGDVHAKQGQAELARAEYRKAFAALTDASEYRRLVEVKLNALGDDPRVAVAAPSEGAR